MKTLVPRRLSPGFAVMLFSVLVLRAQPLPLAEPEELGFAPARLEKLHALVKQHIDDGQYAGAISLIVRGGAIVDWQTYGFRDLEAKLPMERDTIVRIY